MRKKPFPTGIRKWIRTLAAVWILGIALGFSADLLLGPSMTNTASGTATASTAATPPPITITAKVPSVQGGQTSPSAPVVSVFQVAHALNGVSVKNTHVEPLIPSESKQ